MACFWKFLKCSVDLCTSLSFTIWDLVCFINKCVFMLIIWFKFKDLFTFHPPERKLHMIKFIQQVCFLMLELLRFLCWLMNQPFKKSSFWMNPSQRKINTSLPFLIRCGSFKLKPSFKNILVFNHLYINEALSNEIIFILIRIHRFNFLKILIVNLNPNDAFFIIDRELALFFPDRV